MRIFDPNLLEPGELIRVRVRYGDRTLGNRSFEAVTVEVARATAFLSYGIMPDARGEYTEPTGLKVCLEYIFPNGTVYRERFIGTPWRVDGPTMSEKQVASWFGHSGSTRNRK